jgi:Na+-translocating ferredoxin:NAD+ oxidoreductase RnfC subunit
MRAISTGNALLLGNASGVLACSGCGLCTNFACEIGLAPSVVMAALKQELSKAGIKPVPEETIVPEPWIAVKSVPAKRLIARMNLTAFDRPAPWSDRTVHPKRVKLPLRQHVGRASEPVVKPGDRVTKGQLIARIPGGALGAMLHASINGVVTEVNDQMIVLDCEGKEGHP